MDSGSLQSSSGDDEYTSRVAPNSFSLLTHPSPPLFDPLPNYFTDSTNWPNTPTSDPSSLLFDPFSPVPDCTVTAPVTAPQPSSPAPQARNPRKRSRASRRAPTTVLTTDTSNFRAMVQEFTGIPDPPFSTSPFVRARVDLFGAPSRTGSRPSDVLLRPFAQKFQPPQLPLQLQNNYQNQSQGLVNLRNDPVLTFQSLLNQPNDNDQSQLRGNKTNLVSSEGKFDVSQEEKGTNSQCVMEPWLCSSVNRLSFSFILSIELLDSIL